MPSVNSKLEVWNLVLDHLVEHALATELDDSVYARWLTRNWDHLRDALLQAYPWNFAMQYNTLSVDATDPDFRWNYRYKLPPDWLRVIPPTYQGVVGGTPVRHEIVGEYLLCNVNTTMYVRTIQRKETMEDWSPLAVDALALFVAMRACTRFEGKMTLRDRLKEEFNDVNQLARRNDSLMGTPDPVEQHRVLDVRNE